VYAGNLEVLALMTDLVDFARVGEQAGLAVAHRTVLPAALEQLVQHLQVLVGVVVASIVVAQRLLPRLRAPLSR
jgi:hypothetical protein